MTPPTQLYVNFVRMLMGYFTTTAASVEAQIRFRVCKSLEEYDEGSDLTLPDSRVWNLSLATMVKKPQRYGGVLALLKHEFPIAPQDVDRDCHRLVSTFSPKKLVTMNQRIFNISGLSSIQIRKVMAPIAYTRRALEGIFQRLVFPDNTTGVFYYHQSHTSPTRLGELRFRLCSDIRAFAMGKDLLFPSGQPWYISVQSLYLTPSLKSVREHLVEEGLMEHQLYPGMEGSQLASGVAHLTSIGQPFVVGSIDATFPLTFKKRKHLKECLFSGRAVVCLEQYPASPDAKSPGAVFALRVLEFLTPMKRLSPNKDILDPIPGQLLVHCYRNTLEYAPWSYSPRKTAAIAEWICAQSNL